MKFIYIPYKKISYSLFLILLIIILIYHIWYKSSPLYTVLINDLGVNSLSLNLYYTAPNEHILTYQLSNDGLMPLHTRMVHFTEGFLPLNSYRSALKQIKKRFPTAPSFGNFYNYYDDVHYEIFIPTGPLSQVYFLDKNTHNIHLVNTTAFPLPHFYLNHICYNQGLYYLLGDTVNAYESDLYTLDATTLNVIRYKHFKTSPFTVYKQHSTLTQDGHAFFIIKNGLGYIPASCTTAETITLPFTPQYILSNTSGVVALTLDSNTLKYTCLNTQGHIITTAQMKLPEENLLPVGALLQDTFLTLLTFTPNHPIYENYILIYDLNSQKLIYCCALSHFPPYSLLDIARS